MKINQLIFWILIWAIPPSLISAQPNSIIKEFHTTVKGSYKASGSIIPQSTPQNLSPDNRIAITTAVLKGGDLLIDFKLDKSLKREKQLVLLFQPYLMSSTGELLDIHPKHLEGDFQLNYSKKDRHNQIIWLDFSEKFDWGSDAFDLHLRGELRGSWPVNCEKKPSFSMKQQLSHYLLGGLSAGMVVTGYVLKSSSEDLYNQHRDAVFLGRDEEANSRFNKSNTRNKNSEFFKIAGYGIFAANAITYLIRYINYKSNLKAYQYYCADQKLKLTPILGVSPEGANTGLKVNLRF